MLDDDELDAITIVVAWVRFRGLLRLKSNIEGFRARGGRLRVVLGVDEGGATRPGLLGAMRLASRAYVFKDARGGTFHPKVYLGEGAHKAEMLVGSTNLTPGGLYTNVEASTSTVFELPAENQHPALCDVRLFVAGLIDDRQACTRLTRKTVDKLCADKRYRIALNERPRAGGRGRPRGADPADIDETAAGAAGETPGPLFSPSRRRRARIPALTQADKDELAALELDDPQEPQQPEASRPPRGARRPGSSMSTGAVAVTDVWTKKLKLSDAQQVSSNITGLLRLSGGKQKVNHVRWFRRTFFRAPVVWRRTVDSGKHRISLADVPFDVRIDGVDHGTFVLLVDHGPHREADQNNVTTLIHWGPELGAMLREHNHTGQMLTLERLEGGSYRLTID
jgi:hypothetical protein